MGSPAICCLSRGDEVGHRRSSTGGAEECHNREHGSERPHLSRCRPNPGRRPDTNVTVRTRLLPARGAVGSFRRSRHSFIAAGVDELKRLKDEERPRSRKSAPLCPLRQLQPNGVVVGMSTETPTAQLTLPSTSRTLRLINRPSEAKKLCIADSVFSLLAFGTGELKCTVWNS
jgi:hypothetical protein